MLNAPTPDMVFGSRIGHFPGTVSENKQRLEKSDHHLLARVLHDHAGKKHQVIGAFRFGVRRGAAQRVGLEQDVGIGKQQPVASGQLARTPHGVRLAHPTGRQISDVNDFEPAWRCSGRNPLHDLAGLVRRPIVNGDHFVVVVFEGKQASERGLDVGGLVAGRNDDADFRISRRLAVPIRTGNIGDFRHADRRVSKTPEPGQPQNASSNPVEITHPDRGSGGTGFVLSSYNGSEAHTVKEYRRRDRHRDNGKDEGCLQRMPVGDISHKSR